MSGPANPERTLAFLQISLTRGLSLRAAHRVLERIGDPRAMALARPADVVAAGVSEEIAVDLLSDESAGRARREWEQARSLGARIIDLSDPDYPALLRETPDPPLVLYIRGDGWRQDRPHIAIVGSRHPTPYGVNCAERIARDLAGRDVVVVSGLARGIDAAAHRGALRAGSTVAVMGTGVDRIYPAENRSLATAALEHGALISELPLGSLPLPQNFPRRNRILAGMTLATLVVEAAERSGSLITARLALEANREVFAVPGPIHSARSAGPHQLIQQGAHLTTGWEDIARELAPRVELILPTSEPAETPGATLRTTMGVPEKRLLECLSLSEPTGIDALLSRAGFSPSEVYSAMLTLEMQGRVRRLAGDRYIRNET